MLQKVIFFVFVSLLTVFQFSFFPNIFSEYAVPDLIFIVVIYWSITKGFMEIWRKSLLAGFIADLIYFWPIGVNMLAFLLVSFFLTSLSKRLFMRRKILGFGAALAIVFLTTPAYYLFLKGLSEFMRFGYAIKSEARIIDVTPVFLAQKIFLNVILMALLYLPLEKMEKLAGFYSKKSVFEGRFFKK